MHFETFDMNKCVIASDSFKEALSSREVADLFEIEFKKIYPKVKLEKVVLADGGENTLEVFSNHFPYGQYHHLEVTGPNFKKIKAKYFTYDDIAVIESAEACGLALAKEKNPLKTTTYGVGELIKDAYLKGYRKFYISLGGSSTNDGGCGLLSALGLKFFNKDNKKFIPTGGNLNDITNIDDSDLMAKDAYFTILSDVTNAMFGPLGAAYIFAKQKGASEDDIELLDQNLRYLNNLFIRFTGHDVSNISGSGAAGAASSGMLSFLNAKIVSGIETILDLIDFDNIIIDADYVFTGEGRLDNQSFNGKLISGVLKRTSKQNIKIICICGRNDLENIPNNAFYKIYETSNRYENIFSIKKHADKDYLKTVRKVLNELK